MARRVCATHPLREQLHQDPFTLRAFTKPRGYAGDAVMMDYIYGLGEASSAEESATPLGRAMFQYMHQQPSARAVRYRRRLIAQLIDRMAARGSSRVLAIACGHLREVEISNAVLDEKIEEFVAFDQDAASLQVVAREYEHLNVIPIEGSVRQILSGKAHLEQYDFVYAAGLFDYLAEPTARALMSRMFAMVRPGGKMMVPNFLPSTREIGYMEAFMNWDLIYRDHRGMHSLALSLDPEQVDGWECFNDPDDTIVFLLVSKKRAAKR